MARSRSELLVIDASVARAAGPEDAVHPMAKNCRDFLLAVRDICHRMIFTEPIAAEWKQHQSGFARQWRTSMNARKKIDWIVVSEDEALRRQLQEAGTTDKQKEAMLKDAHLIEAASIQGKRIAALDEIVRELFRRSADLAPQLRDICWVNPNRPIEDSLGWLSDGAPADPFRMLGHDPSEE